MKKLSGALQTVRQVFPDAKFARYVDMCHCKQGEQIFWSDKNRQSPDDDGYLEGGFYCPVCKFGNAGKCHISTLLY
jgi:hypothetical protein